VDVAPHLPLHLLDKVQHGGLNRRIVGVSQGAEGEAFASGVTRITSKR
jgi:hypothetical protein